MEFNVFVVFGLFFAPFMKASDIFESLIRVAPCFEVIDVPDECNNTLADSFTSQYPTAGNNRPETLAYLFTNENSDKAEQLHKCGGRLPSNTAYDPKANTEIFIHGWLDGICRTAWMREMADQLFQRGQYNVILIDYSWGNFDYFLTSQNCKVVGEQVGFIIKNIMLQKAIGPEKFHVIGHSFGAIGASYVGRSVPNLRRITGLDPAFSPLAYAPPRERLTYRDANIVDIIHSNAYLCFASGVGDHRATGHADFYPNGGQYQQSCYSYLLESFLKSDVFYAFASLEPKLCSHLQSIQYYKLSINPNGHQYIGVKGRSYEKFKNRTSSIGNNQWAIMGMDYELHHRSNKRNVKFFLDTKMNCPYYDDSYLNGKQFSLNTSCTHQKRKV